METASRASAQSALDPAPARVGTLIYRQSGWTRLTHWIWAISLFFLLLTGLQIFNAHPTLYIGDQSGFGFDNDVLAMRGENTPDGPVGYTRIFGKRFDTTGVLGVSGGPDGRSTAAFRPGRQSPPGRTWRPAASSISSLPGSCPARCWSGWPPASSTATSGAIWRRASPTSASCRATSPTMRG